MIPTKACSSGRRLPWARWVRTPGTGQTGASTGTLTQSAATARHHCVRADRQGAKGFGADARPPAHTRAAARSKQGSHRSGAGESQGENSATHPGRQRIAAQSVSTQEVPHPGVCFVTVAATVAAAAPRRRSRCEHGGNRGLHRSQGPGPAHPAVPPRPTPPTCTFVKCGDEQRPHRRGCP